MNGAGNYHLLKAMPPTFEPVRQDDLATIQRQFVRLLDLDWRNRRMVECALQDLVSRLRDLELLLFPKLRADLLALRQILGPDYGPSLNPLDIRDRRSNRS